MTAIAVELDQRLQSLDPETAASVERLVHDALQLAEKKGGQQINLARRFLAADSSRLGIGAV